MTRPAHRNSTHAAGSRGSGADGGNMGTTTHLLFDTTCPEGIALNVFKTEAGKGDTIFVDMCDNKGTLAEAMILKTALCYDDDDDDAKPRPAPRGAAASLTPEIPDRILVRYKIQWTADRSVSVIWSDDVFCRIIRGRSYDRESTQAYLQSVYDKYRRRWGDSTA